MNVSSKYALGAIALLSVACAGDHGSKHDGAGDGDGDALEDAGTDGGAPLGYYLPTSLVSTWGTGNMLGHPVSKDAEGHPGVIENETCMKGPMQLTPPAKPGMRVVKLADPDQAKLRAALATPSGDGFMGRDDAVKDFFADMTEANSATVAHVHSVEGGTVSFAGAPTPGSDTCDAYASRVVLGARYAVGLKFEFANARSLQAFHAKDPGLTLEQILRQGSTSTPIAFAEGEDGLKSIYVVLARVGGDIGGGFPMVHLGCTPDDLRACARMLDDLDAFADGYLAAFPAPTVEDTGYWAAVRTDIAKLPAKTGDTAVGK